MGDPDKSQKYLNYKSAADNALQNYLKIICA